MTDHDLWNWYATAPTRWQIFIPGLLLWHALNVVYQYHFGVVHQCGGGMW